MSIRCSVPGCNGRNNFSKLTKLYRVPATAVGSNGLIFNLTEKRRKKWFEVLQNYELNENNSSSYRVCSQHFVDGKPSPLFDTKSKDWVPSLNLPEIETVKNEILSDTNQNLEKSKRGRPRTVESEMGPPVNRKTIRSKSVGPSSSTEYTEKSVEENESEQPFVFVDIQKIREGTPIPVREPTPGLISPRARSASPKMGSMKRTFGTQTNPNILPPLKSGRPRKQYGPSLRSIGIQTSPSKKISDDSYQDCLGEMIEYIRKHMLDFSLQALGNGFKIKECALHFEQEGKTVSQKDSNMVLIHQNRLLSSNWPLLESVALSLDLHRLHQKNDVATSSGFIRTISGRTETIEKGTGSMGERERIIIKRNINTLGQVVKNEENQYLSVSSDEQLSKTESFIDAQPLTSPVLPKITSVVSLGDLEKDSENVSEPKTPTAKKLATVSIPPMYSVPKITRLTPKNSTARGIASVNIAPVVSPVRIQKLAPLKKIPFENNAKIQKKLGTTKVPRVNLEKLPKGVVQQISNSGSISVRTVSNIMRDTQGQKGTVGQFQLRTQNATPPLLWLSNVPKEGKMEGQNTPMPAMKNIPVKLPQTQGVAGYLLLPNTSTPGGPTPIMYVPRVALDGKSPAPSGGTPQTINFGDLLNKGLPGVQTLLLPGGVLPAGIPQLVQKDPSTSVVPGLSPLNNSAVVPTGFMTNSSTPKVAIPKLPRKGQSSMRENVIDIKCDDDLQKAVKQDGVMLRCPYCLKQCGDGTEFVNHHKITGCKGGKQTVPNQLSKCDRCHQLYKHDAYHDCAKFGDTAHQYPDCNVCGRIFAKYAFLANHVKTHAEYSDWTEKCNECPKKFQTEDELAEHVSKWHVASAEKGKYQCEKCDKKFTTKKRLECHVQKAHGSKPKKKCVIRIRCKICREVFELDHYREVHWKECQEKKRKHQENGLKESDEDKHNHEEKHNDEIKHNDEEKLNYDSEMEITKKPTGIRSRNKENSDSINKLMDPVEKELTQLFKEQSSAESSHSEYENEEVLDESVEETETIVKKEIIKENKKRKRRFMNLEGSDDEEDDEFVKIPKMEPEETNAEEILNNGLKEEISENIVKKLDIRSLLGMDNGPNDIVIEEMEDDEYFST